jgi:hypothetical protein
LVTLRESDEEEYGSDHYDFTDDKGNFKLKCIPPGSYTIGAYDEDENKNYQTHQKLEVGNEDIDSIVLVVGGGRDRLTTREISCGGDGIGYGRSRPEIRPAEHYSVGA